MKWLIRSGITLKKNIIVRYGILKTVMVGLGIGGIK